MSLLLREASRTDRTAQLCAVDGSFNSLESGVNLLWAPGITGYGINTVIASGMFINFGTLINWLSCSAVGTSHQSDVIEISSFVDNVPIFLSCFNCTSSVDSNYYIFNPWVTHISVPGPYLTNTVTICADLVTTTGILTGQIPDNTIVKWTTAADEDTSDLSAELEYPVGVFTPYNFGDIVWMPSAAQLVLSSVAFATTAHTITFSICDHFSFNGQRTSPTFTFVVLPSIKYDTASVGTNFIVLSGYIDRSILRDIPSNMDVRWRVVPPTDLAAIAFGSLGSTTYTLSADGWGPVLSGGIGAGLQVFTTSYTGSYSITISSATINSSYTNTTPFIPYLDLAANSRLSLDLVAVDASSPTRIYQLNTYGISANGIVHNINPSQDIAFTNASRDTGLIAYDRFSSVYSWYPTESFQSSYGINPLELNITTASTIGTPAVCSYSIIVQALSTYISGGEAFTNIPSNWIAEIDFSIPEWIVDLTFYPNFRINYELPTTYDMYRQTTATFIVNISNVSIIPRDVISGTFVFDFAGDTVTQLFNFSAFQYVMTNTTVAVICSIQLTAFNVFAADWAASLTKKAANKRVHFVTDFPVASNFYVWPTDMWDGSSWQTVYFNGTANTNTPGPTSWGYCHTQRFCMCADNFAGADYYWFIDGVDPFPLTEIDSMVCVDITSTIYSSSQPVSLSIYNSELPVGMPQIFYDDTTGLSARYLNFSSTSYNRSWPFRDNYQLYVLGLH